MASVLRERLPAEVAGGRDILVRVDRAIHIGEPCHDLRQMQRLLPGLRRADECVVCGADLPVGATAWWDARAKAVTCATCHEAQARPASAPSTAAELDRGQAGASVAREHRRRKAAREAEVRAAHPWAGGLLLKVSRAPQREVAFRRGEVGELAVGEILDDRAAKGLLYALHDRRMPGRQGNIDHIAVAPSVYVIDAKHYSGKVRGEDRGFRGVRLMVNGRDRTTLLEGLGRQRAVVRDALAARGHRDVLVHGVLRTAWLPPGAARPCRASCRHGARDGAPPAGARQGWTSRRPRPATRAVRRGASPRPRHRGSSGSAHARRESARRAHPPARARCVREPAAWCPRAQP
jgi:hypothetical protein